MNDAKKWAAFDVAKMTLEIMISHYSALVYQEQQKESPDLAKIQEWEALQDSLTDQDIALSVDHEAQVESINRTYLAIAKALMQKG